MAELAASSPGGHYIRLRDRSGWAFAVDRLKKNVFLADNCQGLVIVLKSQGTFFRSFKANPDQFESQFDSKMKGLAFDPHTKYLYVCGCGLKGPNHAELIGQVAVFDTTAGEYLYSVGRGLLRNPIAITLDSNHGLLFVAETMPFLKIVVFQM